MRSPRLLAIALLGLMSAAATSSTTAQQPTQSGTAAQRSNLSAATRRFVSVDAPVVALTHVRLVDGTGAPAREDQTVVITGDKISAVGKTGSVAVPAGAQTIDLTGHTVIPGIVGLHDHTF